MSSALAGYILVLNVNVPSILIVFDFAGETEKLETAVATVTVHVAVRPLLVVAVITAVPFFRDFTRPLASTVATAVLELVRKRKSRCACRLQSRRT